MKAEHGVNTTPRTGPPRVYGRECFVAGSTGEGKTTSTEVARAKPALLEVQARAPGCLTRNILYHCLCMCASVCMRVCVHVSVCARACARACMCVCSCVHVCVCARACMFVCARAGACVCVLGAFLCW